MFSKTLGPDRVISGEEMKITLYPSKPFYKNIYCYRAKHLPVIMRKEAKAIIDRLVKEGVIRPVHEAKNTCVPASFVCRKSWLLRFVVDFKALNRSIIRLVLVVFYDVCGEAGVESFAQNGNVF